LSGKNHMSKFYEIFCMCYYAAVSQSCSDDNATLCTFQFCGWLFDWVKVLRPTRHKISHFGDVLPSQSLG